MLRYPTWKISNLWLIIFFIQLKGCWAVSVNVTIDDTLGDAVTGRLPVYSPNLNSTAWAHCNATVCPSVGEELFDVTQIVDGTWSIATWSPDNNSGEGPGYSVTMNFTGKIFVVLANLSPAYFRGRRGNLFIWHRSELRRIRDYAF